MARLLEMGKSTALRPVFIRANTRAGCLHVETKRIHEPFRSVLRKLVKEASQAQDFQVTELAYQLKTISKYLGVSPGYTTLLPGHGRVPLREFLHHNVMTAAKPFLEPVEELPPVKRIAS